MAMWIKGSNNLIPFPYYEDSVEENGITITVNNDGTITLNGECTADIWFALRHRIESDYPIKAGTYTLSGATNGVLLYITENNTTNYYNWSNAPVTFTITEQPTLYMQLKIFKGATLNNVVIKPMLNKGETALPYEPYRPPQKVKAVFKSRNLIKFPTNGWYEGRTHTNNGVTYTVGKYGTFTLSGTGIGNYGYYIFVSDDGGEDFLRNITTGTYTATLERIDGGVFNADEPCTLEIRQRNADGQVLYGFRVVSNDNIDKTKMSVTFNLAEGEHIQRLAILHTGGYTYNMVVRVTLSKGTIPYSEPYFPLTKFKMIPKSRNALDIADYTGTHFGVTIDIKDGVISLSGTSERAADIWIKINKPIKAGTYSNNGFTDGAMFFLCKEYADLENRQALRESVSNILPYDCTYGLIYFDGGITFDKKIKIMLNKGDTPLPYEPPQEIWK